MCLFQSLSYLAAETTTGTIRGVQQLGPNRCAIFMYLLPVLTAAAAIVMLGEPVRPFHIIGGGLTPAWVVCAQILRSPLMRHDTAAV